MDDKITIERIGYMHPAERAALLADYRHVNNKILGKGCRLRFAYTIRTIEEQRALFALGRTVVNPQGKSKKKPMGNIVTNADGGESIHNYCLAFDIVILYDLNGDGIFETASWDLLKDFDRDGEADWMEVVKYFKSRGWSWGGDFKSIKDSPHFEKTYGLNWREMRRRLQAGNVTSEVIKGKTYKFIKL